MIYADFDYYKDVYMGVQITDEAIYKRLATRAAADLDYYTFGKAAKYADLEAVKMAACAVAEQREILEKAQNTAAGDTGELQSESVGSYSRSYRSSAETSASARAAIVDVITRYLATTGLLYRGASVCIHHIR